MEFDIILTSFSNKLLVVVNVYIYRAYLPSVVLYFEQNFSTSFCPLNDAKF